MKKLIAALTTAGLLVAGTAGIAGAAETPKTKAPTATAEGRARRAAALEVAATTIGIERKALLAALRDGQSVADVARANDVDPQAVVDAIIAARNAKIDAALDAGKITEDRAATMKERGPDRITKLVNGERVRRHRGERAKIRRHARRAGFAIAADTIGVSPRELLTSVRDGESVADVARANDVDPQAVIDAVVAAATEKIDAAVDAGKITADRAGTLKERLTDRITKRVNATPRERIVGS